MNEARSTIEEEESNRPADHQPFQLRGREGIWKEREATTLALPTEDKKEPGAKKHQTQRTEERPMRNTEPNKPKLNMKVETYERKEATGK